MKKLFSLSILCAVFCVFTAFPTVILSQDKMDIFDGHFSREGNSESPSKVIRHNIYIKFFEDQWIVTLHVPLPNASEIKPDTITRAMEEAKKQTSSAAYIRSKFGQLPDLAIATIEKYGYAKDAIMFECNSLAPCTINLKNEYLELIKPGMINDHIIKYKHIISDDKQI